MGKVKEERRGRNREAESGEKTVFREINLPSDLQQEARGKITPAVLSHPGGKEECFTCGDLSITTQAHFKT